MNASATPVPSDPCLASSETGDLPSEHSPHRHDALPKLALGALGVVFGDIGTSPLYAIQAIMTGEHPLPIDLLNIYGVISLIFWTMVTVVTIKYVLLVLRLDNNGEGGSLALLALINRKLPALRGTRLLVAGGLLATALFYAIRDGHLPLARWLRKLPTRSIMSAF